MGCGKKVAIAFVLMPPGIYYTGWAKCMDTHPVTHF